MTGSNNNYDFSFNVDVARHDIWTEPEESGITVPLAIFSHTSTVQALARYLVDTQEYSFSDAARLLNRSPKSIWSSYHQTEPLPKVDTNTLEIPLGIFTQQYAPLETLVLYLREQNFSNVEIARALNLSPKTTHTAWKRAEVKR